MNQIYGSANRVIVWLGKASPELEAGVKAAARLGTESVPHTIRMIRTQTWDFSNDLSNMSEKYGMEPIDTDEAIGLSTLFSCNYFVRIWVIQEVCLTEDVVILCNGNFTPFDCVGYTAAFLHYSGLYQHVYALAPYVRKVSFMRDDVNMFEAERICLFREWCKDEKTEWFEVLEETVDFEAGIGHTQPKSAEMILLRFLITSIQFRSTDRRDIIYGLGGIIKKMAVEYGSSFPAEFEPNYDIDVKDLLTDVARKIFETTDSLVCLGLVKDRGARDIPGLPSWVPNFSPVPVNSLSGANFRSTGTFDASKHIPHTLSEQVFTVDGDTLNVAAFCLGKVEKLGEAFLTAMSGEQKMNSDLLRSMEQVYLYTGQPSDEAFWRILVFDHDLSYRPAKLIRLEDFQTAMMGLIVRPLAIRHREASSTEEGQALVLESISQMSYLDRVSAKLPSSIFPRVNLIKSMCMNIGLIPKGEVDLNDEERKLLTVPKSNHSMPPELVLVTTYVGHRPFLTGSGYLGMGLESVEVGDEVWVVKGCPTPLVLRREGKEFSLVGESYVHGVMNGEAVGDDTKWEKIQIV